MTREDALEALDHFIAACLPIFGDYQDAMKQGNAFLYHSVISPYLNVGLLTPREICERGGGRPGARARRRSTRSKASSARSSAGANMCAASTG